MVAPFFIPRDVKKGEYVYREGDKTEEVYLVLSGDFQMTKNVYSQDFSSIKGHPKSKKKQFKTEANIGMLKKYEIFGEEPFFR